MEKIPKPRRTRPNKSMAKIAVLGGINPNKSNITKTAHDIMKAKNKLSLMMVLLKSFML